MKETSLVHRVYQRHGKLGSTGITLLCTIAHICHGAEFTEEAETFAVLKVEIFFCEGRQHTLAKLQRGL